MTDCNAVDILLAEDSDFDAEITLRAFRKGGLLNKVYRVYDGLEALQFVFREGSFAQRDLVLPRLILLDIKMPRVDGIDALRKLKADDLTQSIPVVVLTSSVQEQDMLGSYALGVHGYLVKPVQTEAFSQLVTQTRLHWIVMRRSSPQQPYQ